MPGRPSRRNSREQVGTAKSTPQLKMLRRASCGDRGCLIAMNKHEILLSRHLDEFDLASFVMPNALFEDNRFPQVFEVSDGNTKESLQ